MIEAPDALTYCPTLISNAEVLLVLSYHVNAVSFSRFLKDVIEKTPWRVEWFQERAPKSTQLRGPRCPSIYLFRDMLLAMIATRSALYTNTEKDIRRNGDTMENYCAKNKIGPPSLAVLSSPVCQRGDGLLRCWMFSEARLSMLFVLPKTMLLLPWSEQTSRKMCESKRNIDK